MKLRQFIIIACPLYLFAATSAIAEEIFDAALAVDSSSLDDDAAALYGAACEKIKPREAKSSVRLRATDKASFEAVKNLSELDAFKSKSGEHDFNVLVYNIVDNYVEDLAVRTTKQNETEICVEVTGFVKKGDLTAAMSSEADSQPEETTFAETGASLSSAPSAEEEIREEPQKTSEPEISATEVLIPQEVAQTAEADEAKSPKKLLYIAPVSFFNNTVSEKHKQILKEIFGKNEAFYLTENKDTADYIISAKVMRAKVDPINSNTNRLQMVLSVGVEFTDSGASTVEHQNRFILFANGDNEQEVAAKLMRKLLTKAGEQILNKVEADIRRSAANDNSGKIITPK